jgi:sigma-B regulation protein RsbU (phosphoserine phosphatase)
MDQQNGMYFTIWYGIYHKSTRHIEYAGGGHPPALLLTGPTRETAKLKILESQGPMIGADPDLTYESQTCQVEDFGRLYLFSDGVYEIEQTDRTMWPFHAFIDFMSQIPPPGETDSTMDHLVQKTVEIGGTDDYKDDFSIVEFRFLSHG